MARTTEATIDDVIRSAMEKVMKRASAQIARVLADAAARQIDQEITQALAKKGKAPRAAARTARRAGDITKWSADKSARRVPNFVKEQTGGLDTKKKIVAKYGDGATFEKGKPLPKPKEK